MPLPIQFLLFMLIGWVSRRQEEAIEYLRAENKALLEQLGGKRLRFTDSQRRRLARRAKRLGRRRLGEISPIVTPDTLLRWYRELVAQKYDGSARRGPGRPRIAVEIQRLILEMANDNPRWGYTRIQGALANFRRRIVVFWTSSSLKRSVWVTRSASSRAGCLETQFQFLSASGLLDFFCAIGGSKTCGG